MELMVIGSKNSIYMLLYINVQILNTNNCTRKGKKKGFGDSSLKDKNTTAELMAIGNWFYNYIDQQEDA